MSGLSESLSKVVQKAASRAIEAAQLVTVRALDRRLRALRSSLEELIMTSAETAYEATLARVAAYYGVLLAENASLRNTVAEKDKALSDASAFTDLVLADLDAEKASKATEIKTAVDAALELDAQKDAARIEEILRQAGEALPAPVPPVVVPEPGEPAEIPADADIEPVDESELPTTDPTTPDVDPVPSDPATEPGDTPDAGDEIDPGPAGEEGGTVEGGGTEPATDEGPLPAEDVPADGGTVDVETPGVDAAAPVEGVDENR